MRRFANHAGRHDVTCVHVRTHGSPTLRLTCSKSVFTKVYYFTQVTESFSPEAPIHHHSLERDGHVVHQRADACTAIAFPMNHEIITADTISITAASQQHHTITPSHQTADSVTADSITASQQAADSIKRGQQMSSAQPTSGAHFESDRLLFYFSNHFFAVLSTIRTKQVHNPTQTLATPTNVHDAAKQ